MKKFEIIDLINECDDPVAQEVMLKAFNMLCDTTYEIRCRRVAYRVGLSGDLWGDAYSLYKELGL